MLKRLPLLMLLLSGCATVEEIEQDPRLAVRNVVILVGASVLLGKLASGDRGKPYPLPPQCVPPPNSPTCP